MEDTNENLPDYLNQPESFHDIAKVCLKKKNKGPFDEVITSLYRYHKLVEYLKDDKSLPKQENKLLLGMLTKGLRYKNFQEFKEENISSEAFNFLKDITNIKEFIAHLDSKNIKKTFLELIRDKLKEHEEGLLFLRHLIDKEIEKKEKAEKMLKMSQSKGNNLKI